MPKVSALVVTVIQYRPSPASGVKWPMIQIHAATFKRPKPTTTRPITAPLRKATRSA